MDKFTTSELKKTHIKFTKLNITQRKYMYFVKQSKDEYVEYIMIYVLKEK